MTDESIFAFRSIIHNGTAGYRFEVVNVWCTVAEDVNINVRSKCGVHDTMFVDNESVMFRQFYRYC